MTRRSRRAQQFKGHSPLVIAAFALTLYISLSPKEQRFTAKHPPSAKVTEAEASRKDSDGLADTSILLDSIVSLVQNYYVDSGRVGGEQLILGTMRSMAYAIPEFSFHDGTDQYSISAKSETLTFNKDSDFGYEEVLGRLRSLVSFCDRVGVADIIGPGENLMLGADRDSASVVLNALLSSLDAHSSLLSTEAYQELRQGTEGSFGGLGVLVGIRDNVLTVLKPLPRSPAQRMGVKQNDKIIAIDGHNTFGQGLDTLVTHMRGSPGTSADLVTLRSGDWAPRRIRLEREVIAVDSVEASEFHNNNVHVLKLAVENFASRTSKEIKDQIKKFRHKFPMSGLVLDLRGNPGGLLDQAVQVSDIFLDAGVLVTTRGRREEVERASHDSELADYPMVVLMNEDSASASEIVAGALQDNGRAIVIGQPSFGKGSVQTVFELPDQRALKLTIARYFTPANKSIQNIGIMPDIWIQPVFKATENANLFGSYRYRNEQFLPNHLVVAPQTYTGSLSPLIKGYSLISEFNSDKSIQSADTPMDVSMAVFNKLHETYGKSLPEGARRSAHWVALARASVNEILNPLSQNAISWLQTKHSVRWKGESLGIVSAPAVKLEIIAPSDGFAAVAGGILEVPWRIQNNGDSGLENVSVFVQSQVSGLETKEFLVGHLDAGEKRRGVVKIQVPHSSITGKRYVSAGVAVDAQALQSAQDEFLINVREQISAPLAAGAVFIDGNNSKQKNILEANEQGTVAVSISNKGLTEVRDVKVVISNLGGKQVQISVPEVIVSVIKPGEERKVNVPIVARSRIESGSILLGISVKHSSSVDPIFALSDVKTSKSINSATIDSLSH